MRVLLDSHAMIWALDDPTKLSPAAAAALQSAYRVFDAYGVPRIWN